MDDSALVLVGFLLVAAVLAFVVNKAMNKFFELAGRIYSSRRKPAAFA